MSEKLVMKQMSTMELTQLKVEYGEWVVGLDKVLNAKPSDPEEAELNRRGGLQLAKECARLAFEIRGRYIDQGSDEFIVDFEAAKLRLKDAQARYDDVHLVSTGNG